MCSDARDATSATEAQPGRKLDSEALDKHEPDDLTESGFVSRTVIFHNATRARKKSKRRASYVERSFSSLGFLSAGCAFSSQQPVLARRRGPLPSQIRACERIAIGELKEPSMLSRHVNLRCRRPMRLVHALPVPPLTCLGPVGFFLAGGICSSLSHVVATPIDVVKTKQQDEQDASADRRAPGMLAMGWKLVQAEGPAALLRGADATFSGYFMHGALKYGFFELWQSVLRVGEATFAARIPLLCLCAFLAELVATVVLCPAESARIMLVTDPEYVEPAREEYKEQCRQKKGCHPFSFILGGDIALALKQLRRDQGVREGWFGALVPLLMKQCAYTVAKLVTYDVVNSVLAPNRSFYCRVFSAMCAATTATLASQPADTIFTCVSREGGECPVPMDDSFMDDEPPSVWKLMRDASARLGVRGLFAGWRTRICQMSLIVVMQLLMYDSIRPRS